MKHAGYYNIVLLLLLSLSVNAKEYADSAIYQGINLKLDLFNSVYYPALTKGDVQSYEIAMNVKLKQRFYPTLELGYAQGTKGNYTPVWDGQGGWGKVGLDINGLKKNPSNPNALLVGIRVGTAYQQYETPRLSAWDYWGEVVGGCQVQVYKGFMMGWYARLKLLFTSNPKTTTIPDYIPGFGYRNNTQWGISYYLGWKF